MTPRPVVSIGEDAASVATIAADIVEETLARCSDAVLALPTGRTPIPLYWELGARFRAGRVDFSQAWVFNLDEWVGVAAESDGSFTRFMNEHFFSQVNCPPDRRAIPNGLAADLDAECRRYEGRIAETGGLDLVILGLGLNGHIGFNEPGTSFDSRTHVVQVTLETRLANAYMFSDREPPESGLSMGIATIMSSRAIMLLVTGPDKADALERALYGPVDESLPASVLQRHPAVHVVADRAAATELTRT